MKKIFLAFALLLALWCPVRASAQYMQIPVMLGNAEIGKADIRSASPQGDVSILSPELGSWIGREMQEKTNESYRANISAAGILDVNTSNVEGLRIFYDAVDGVIRIIPDPAYLRPQSISVTQGQPGAAGQTVPPAAVSGFVNVRGGMDYLYDQPVNGGRQPLQADIDGAIRVKGTVLESLLNYTEDEKRAFSRGETRLVRDWPGQMIRAAAGDLSYPVSGFQSYQPMLGVSVARNFSLQPYRVTTPSGEASFTLRSSSQVEVQVNGRTVRTFRLEPGTYDISDFPVTDGGNDVTLLITDATGNVERRAFPLLSDQQLLAEGLHAFSYNFGVESENVNREIRYRESNPAFSLFHRYGITESLTAGIGVQADEDVRQATMTLIKAFDIGIIGVEGGYSHTPFADAAGAGRLSFRRVEIDKGRIYSAETSYRQRGFGGIGYQAATIAPPEVLDSVARVTQSFPSGFNVGAGLRYRRAEAPSSDDWSFGVNMDKSYQNGLSVSVTAEQQRVGGAGVFMTLSWSPPLSRHSMTASVDTVSGTQSVDWDYNADHHVNSFRGGAGVTHYNDRSRTEVTGNIDYTGYRGEVALRHDVIATGANSGEAAARTHLQAGTAFVFADGHAGLSRPVTGSFILFPRTGAAVKKPVGINPATASAEGEKENFQAEIDGFGAGVIPDAMAYMYRPVQIDTRGFPVGYDIAADHFTVMPEYKSGTVISLGAEARLSASGILTDAAGKPMALQGGEIMPLNRKSQDRNPETQDFFTNQQGRFQISRLKPGTYALRLYGFPGQAAEIVVPDEATGIVDLGTRQLQQKGPAS